MRLRLALAALVLATAAAPAPDPVLEKVLAGARAVSPGSIAYERSMRTVAQEAGSAVETRTRTERWDGRTITPLTVDGRPATPAEVAQARKAAAGKPVAGYHRLADFLKAGAVRVSESEGRIVYRIAALPKGTINIGKDISENLVGEAVVDASGPQPFVSRLRVYLPKPLSFFMVAKLDSFELVNDYRLGPGSKPALAKAVQSLAGTQFGKAGTTRTEASYTILN